MQTTLKTCYQTCWLDNMTPAQQSPSGDILYIELKHTAREVVWKPVPSTDQCPAPALASALQPATDRLFHLSWSSGCICHNCITLNKGKTCSFVLNSNWHVNVVRIFPRGHLPVEHGCIPQRHGTTSSKQATESADSLHRPTAPWQVLHFLDHSYTQRTIIE